MGKRVRPAAEPWLSARRLTYFSIGGVFLLAGLGMYVWITWTESAAQSWPTTTGQVLETSVSKVAGRGTAYAPVILYRYEVAGTIYRSRKIELAGHPNFGSSEEAADYAANYPPGAEVVVHYDPTDPTTAALFITSSQPVIYAFIAIGLVMAAMGLYRR